MSFEPPTPSVVEVSNVLVTRLTNNSAGTGDNLTGEQYNYAEVIIWLINLSRTT